MSNLRKEVLNIYKKLHLARLSVFEGDDKALEAARHKLNDEFKKNKSVKDPNEIQILLKMAKEVEVELRTSVVQAVEKEPGIYEARITPETRKLENVMFDPNAELPLPRTKRCRDPSSDKK